MAGAAAQQPPAGDGGRVGSCAEVDLLLEQHGELKLAVEIKGKKRVSGADLSGLRSFAEAHLSVPRYVVAEVPEGFEIEGCRVLPFRVWLSEIGSVLRRSR
ncbi:MAG: hypothetical protein AB1714_17820 [Acidobacteriota bacterium]